MLQTTLLCAILLAPVGALAADVPTSQPAGWKLVWSDEFDQRQPSAAPDPAKWKYETGYIRNKEKQYYTSDRRDNVRVEEGSLVIEARKERYEIPGKPGTFADYTAGSIETRGLAQWQYGKVEVRAKIPTGKGMWPAIWMLSDSISKVGWPACGEIDIMENVGFDPDFVHGSIHTKAYNHVIKTEKTKKVQMQKPWEQFHVYAIEWNADQIDFFIDGNRYFTFKNEGTGNDAWPFSQPFYLKLNTAVGGAWGGQKGIDDDAFPAKFYIDYVRVYQR